MKHTPGKATVPIHTIIIWYFMLFANNVLQCLKFHWSSKSTECDLLRGFLANTCSNKLSLKYVATICIQINFMLFHVQENTTQVCFIFVFCENEEIIWLIERCWKGAVLEKNNKTVQFWPQWHCMDYNKFTHFIWDTTKVECNVMALKDVQYHENMFEYLNGWLLEGA